MAQAGIDSSDVLVLGGGPTGLAAALALADAGCAVTVIDSAPDAAQDQRTAALMASSVRMLDRLGVWNACRKSAAPLRRLRIIDDTGRLLRAPTVEFSAGEIGEEAFGWNIPHSVLLPELGAACDAAPRVTRRSGRAESIAIEDEAATVHLAGGGRARAPLLVGADGRHSPSRRAAGIRTRQWRYAQAAIVANLRHERPHEDTSTEFHRPPGPFTLVPLPGERSSLVWVETERTAEALSRAGPEGLAEEVTRLSRRILGEIEIDGAVGVFPLGGLEVSRYAARRVALVGEAAHIMPPIAAQGLNLGLRDAAALADVVRDAARLGGDVGALPVTDAYDRMRHLDVMTRLGAVDLLNRSLLSDLLSVQALRAGGLTALGTIGPLRRLFMREGIGPQFVLPRLMQRAD